jgi:hypothetical protein
VLKSLVFEPSGFVVWLSWPNQTGAVGHSFVHHDSRAVVEDVGDVAQRAQVILDRLELPQRHGRERRVFAVGGEEPRVVREAGAEPACARDRAERRRKLLALVGPADLQVRCGLR